MQDHENTIKENNDRNKNGVFFRKKSLDSISSPDQLYDYIHVTTPSVWIVMLAVIILLAGMIIWSFTGKIEVKGDDGSSSTVRPIEYVIN